MKTCGKCNVSKETTEFHKQSRNKDGLQSICKPCRKQLDKECWLSSDKKKLRNNQRRACLVDRLRKYKEEKGCKYCRERCGVALDFHHKDDDKEFSVMDAIKRFAEARLWEEVKKCDVVCSNCHRKIHAGLIDCSLV